MLDIATISIFIAIAGCFVGLAGWIYNRDKKVSSESEWRGGVMAKLDNIIGSVTGLSRDVERIDARLNEHAERIAKCEGSTKQAHHRLDSIERKDESHED